MSGLLRSSKAQRKRRRPLGFEGVHFLLDLQSTQIRGGALWCLVLDQVPWMMTKIDQAQSQVCRSRLTSPEETQRIQTHGSKKKGVYGPFLLHMECPNQRRLSHQKLTEKKERTAGCRHPHAGTP